MGNEGLAVYLVPVLTRKSGSRRGARLSSNLLFGLLHLRVYYVLSCIRVLLVLLQCTMSRF